MTATLDTPLVSVVTVCYNAERHLAAAMESVLAQTYPHIEYLLIDGGSTDGTLDIIRSFEPRFSGHLRLVSEPDEGIYDAMNKGIALANGEIIGLLNADDEYPPGAIAAVAEAYASHPGTGAVYGDAIIVDEGGAEIRTERAADLAPGRTRPARMPMCHQSLFVSRKAYDEIGVYDASLKILADYDWILRALASRVTLTYIPVPLARFRTGGACSADMRRSNAEREIIRVRHGANPAVERVRRIRHTVNNAAYAVLVRVRSRRSSGDDACEGGRK